MNQEIKYIPKYVATDMILFYFHPLRDINLRERKPSNNSAIR